MRSMLLQEILGLSKRVIDLLKRLDEERRKISRTATYLTLLSFNTEHMGRTTVSQDIFCSKTDTACTNNEMCKILLGTII